MRKDLLSVLAGRSAAVSGPTAETHSCQTTVAFPGGWGGRTQTAILHLSWHDYSHVWREIKNKSSWTHKLRFISSFLPIEATISDSISLAAVGFLLVMLHVYHIFSSHYGILLLSAYQKDSSQFPCVNNNHLNDNHHQSECWLLHYVTCIWL